MPRGVDKVMLYSDLMMHCVDSMQAIYRFTEYRPETHPDLFLALSRFCDMLEQLNAASRKVDTKDED